MSVNTSTGPGITPPFDLLWPWIGLGAAGLILLLLFATDGLRDGSSAARSRDLVWLAWAATCAYLIHQFEEHGIDVRGDAYAFRGSLCATLDYQEAGSCPIPTAFITAVNIPAVWLAGPACALLGRRWPFVALSFFSVVFVNALVHIGPALASWSYNPGLVTAVILFLPLSLLAFRVAMRTQGLGRRAVLATIVAGVALHAVLMVSLLTYIAGRIGLALLLTIQVLNPAIPPLLGSFVAAPRRRVARAAAAP